MSLEQRLSLLSKYQAKRTTLKQQENYLKKHIRMARKWERDVLNQGWTLPQIWEHNRFKQLQGRKRALKLVRKRQMEVLSVIGFIEHQIEEVYFS